MNTRVVSDKFQDLQQKATETAKNVGQAADKYVRDNTWMTIAIAAVVGCLVGYLITNRED